MKKFFIFISIWYLSFLAIIVFGAENINHVFDVVKSHLTYDTLIQVGVALPGLTGIYMLVGNPTPTNTRYAPLVAIIGQPFWLYSTFTHQLYGMFFVCCCYTVIYSKGALKALLWKTPYIVYFR